MSTHLNVAACDDDKTARSIIASTIKEVLRSYDVDSDVSIYSSADILAADMPGKRFDLLLLDIDMPGTDGITFARQLRETDASVDIIYISGREDLVFKSLSTSPEGFIRKGRFLEDMSEVIGNYLRQREKRLKAGNPVIVLQTRSGMKRVDIAAISYVEGAHKQQLIYLSGEKEPYSVNRSLQDIEEELQPYGFIRIHKGYLVNYRYIRRLESAEALLKDGTKIPLSRRKLNDVKEQYLELMQSEGNLIF